MSVILSLNAFHPDSSACLLIDGKLIGAVSEERFGETQNHISDFPVNPTRWALKERTGYGIVLNTSFNENEPVVDRPEQAIACFNRTEMDVLVLGMNIITKPDFKLKS